ncbi:MAG: DUF5335 family protein [Pyrinomonadaceae bacterium]
MTLELKRAEWRPFFDGLSRDLENWDTMVHVLDGSSGAQLLTERLPFHGLTLENVGGRETIGLSVGFGDDSHQTHNILRPTKIAFAKRGSGPAGTLDIEDATGTTTLITFIEPHRELMGQGPTSLAGR